MFSAEIRNRSSRKMLAATAVLLLLSFQALLSTRQAAADSKKSAPAAKSAPAPKAASTSKSASPTSKSGTAGGAASHTATAGSKAGGGSTGGKTTSGAGGKPAVGTVKTNSNGTRTVVAKNGELTKSPSGKPLAFKGNNGHEARFTSTGKVKEVRAGNMTITHGPGNMRRSVVENRETHTRFVAEGHGRGYIEHRYEYGGHAYYARGYYYHGGYYRNYYHPYYYGGVQVYGYVPAYYYPPAYYGWAYNPWPAPAPYAWGWGAAPWYGYYGAYFAPYPVYPAPAYWLADYIIAATLQAAFIAQAENANVHMPALHNGPQVVLATYSPGRGYGVNYSLALAAAAAGDAVVLSPEIKKAVTDEIQSDLAARKAQAANTDDSSIGSLTTLLADNKPHVFVAGSAITATSGGQDCNITEGDVLSLPSAPAKDSENANLSVLASKSTDCAKGNTVAVPITDLQEMYNHLLASVDKGLGEMKDNAGKGGIPAPPADATAGSKEAPYAAAAPPPEKDGSAQLDAQAADAAKTEQQVLAEANEADGSGAAVADGGSAGKAPGTAVAAAPAKMETITLGQTIAEVVAMKGQPKNILNFTTKQIYVYPDMKITFVKGKIADVN